MFQKSLEPDRAPSEIDELRIRSYRADEAHPLALFDFTRAQNDQSFNPAEYWKTNVPATQILTKEFLLACDTIFIMISEPSNIVKLIGEKLSS